MKHTNRSRLTKSLTLIIKLSVFSTLTMTAAASAAEDGVSDDTITIGTSSNLEGKGNARPLEIKRGSDLVFKTINDAGGIHGRKIKVIAYDDGYVPQRTVENAKKLVEQDKVFSLFGFYGAPMSKAVLPYISRSPAPFFGASSGVEAMRNPVTPNVFNVRLSYSLECAPLVDYLVNEKKFKRIAVLAQEGPLGDEGRAAVLKQLVTFKLQLASEATFNRTSGKVDDGYEKIKKGNPQAVLIIGNSEVAADFIKKARSEKQTWIFGGPSTLSSSDIINGGQATEGTIISLGLPPPGIDMEINRRYKEDLKKSGINPKDANIEGYVAALVFVEGLKRAGKKLTRENFINELEKIKDFDLGGISVSFSKDDHQGLKKGFISIVKNGVLELAK